jgi:hypothetical protein
MLFVVLALVAVAFGLLVVAFVTTTMLFAWVSVGVSALAAVALFVDSWLRRRKAGTEPAADEPSREPAVTDVTSVVEEQSADVELPAADGDEEPDEEPADEDTDAADVLAVSELDVEVRVVDERPHYHLASCAWLGAKPTLPLPVGEARQLGFAPCAVCTPDRVLAAARRKAVKG